jgi:hypothetical protein
MSYVQASHEMPYLSDREVEAMARQYGFAESDEEVKIGERDVRDGCENSSDDKPRGSNSEGAVRMLEEQESELKSS